MPHSNMIPTPPSEEALTEYSRPHPTRAAADAIPILVDDTYHIFHLTTPTNTVHHPPRLRSVWSRIRSKDLVTWTRDADPVISPGSKPTDPDISGAWTGSAVLGPDGNMHIFYTGYSLPQDGKQVILHVSSADKHGSYFDQKNRTPIKIHHADSSTSRFEDIDFRDPYIFFNKEAGKYWMLVATRLREGPHWTRGCIALLVSSDLEEWTMQPEPLYAPNDMFCPECPELFQLSNGKWYLVYSRFSAPDSGTVYRIADSPQGPFHIPRDGSRGRLDGRRWYAAKSCPKAGDPSRRVYFGWIADYYEDDGKWLWGGDLGVPREISADGNGYLRVQPAKEVMAAFQHMAPLSGQKGPSSLHLSSESSTSVEFPQLQIATDTAESTMVSIDIKKYDAASFGLVFDADDNLKSHRLRLSKSGPTWTAVLFTDSIPLDDFWADQYNLHIPRSVDGPEIVRHEGLNLDSLVTILLREHLIEIFVGGRSISYRLPQAREKLALNGNGSQQARRPLGFFVEDGEVDIDLSLNRGELFAGPAGTVV